MKKFISFTACIILAVIIILAGCKKALSDVSDMLSDISSADSDFGYEELIGDGDFTDEETESEPNSESKPVKSEKSDTAATEEAEDFQYAEDIVPDVPFGVQQDFRCHGYSYLNGTQKEYYKIMLASVNYFKTGKVLISKNGKDDNVVNNLRLAFSCLIADHPELFWMQTSFSTAMRTDTKDIYIEFEYLDNDTKLLAEKRLELQEKVDSLLNETQDMSAFEKEVYFHDYLCENVSYEKNDGYCRTVYGALIEGKSVCEGYAKAMQLLCNAAGINCVTVRGSVTDGGEHMWNKIELLSDWYALDVTWDDPINTETTSYAYFNLTDAKMRETHIPDVEYTKDSLPQKLENLEFNFCLPAALGTYFTADKID